MNDFDEPFLRQALDNEVDRTEGQSYLLREFSLGGILVEMDGIEYIKFMLFCVTVHGFVWGTSSQVCEMMKVIPVQRRLRRSSTNYRVLRWHVFNPEHRLPKQTRCTFFTYKSELLHMKKSCPSWHHRFYQSSVT